MKKYTTILLIIITVWSCKTTKKLGPVPERSKDEIISSLVKRNIDFKWLSAKVSTSIESPDENISGTLHVRMKANSIVWVVVKKLGIEAARIMANKDDYTILYRFESAYEVWPLSQLKSYVHGDVQFADVQQWIFGNVIIPDKDNSTLHQVGTHYVLETKIDNLLIKYFVNGYTAELEKMELIDNENNTASVQYADYRKISTHGKFSFNRIYKIPYPSGEQGTITMQLSDVEIDVPKEIKFTIPSHYEKIN